MAWKILRTPLLLLAPFVGFTLSFTILAHSAPPEPVQSISPPPVIAQKTVVAPKQEIQYGLPLRLKIPKLEVDATIAYVGINPDGAMDTTKNPDDVAWFQPGPRPGMKGNAVIAGHYGWENGATAIFDDLHTLQEGDKIYVEDDTGTTIAFTVRESRSYDATADSTDVFQASDEASHLNLITCEGGWSADQQSYSNRRVVFADRE